MIAQYFDRSLIQYQSRIGKLAVFLMFLSICCWFKELLNVSYQNSPYPSYGKPFHFSLYTEIKTFL